MVVIDDFSMALKEDVDYLMWKVYNDYPGVLIIDGGTGTGKTTLAVQIADYGCRKPIILKNQLALGIKATLETIVQAYDEGYRVVIFDEATEFNKRRAMTRDNVDMVDMFAMARALHVVIIICLPSVGSLDNEIKSHDFVYGLIHIFSRDAEQCYFGAYGRQELGYILEKMSDKAQILKEQVYNYIHPNYYGVAKNLSPARAKELHEVSVQYKLDKIKEKVARNNGDNDKSRDNSVKRRDEVWRDAINKILIDPDPYLWKNRKKPSININKIMIDYKVGNQHARTIKNAVEEALRERGTIV